MLRLHRFYDTRRRLQHGFFKQARRHAARPAIEQLQHFGARIPLRDQVRSGCFHQNIHQPGKKRSVTPGQLADGFVIGAALTLDHISGDGPGRPRKPDQRGVRGQGGAHILDGLHHRRQHLRPIHQPAQRAFIRHRLQPRAFAFGKPDFLTQRMGEQKNVGEQNGGIEIDTPHRLQRHFRRQRRIKAERDEILRLGPQRAIFRQIAPSLAHQPDWRHSVGLAFQHDKNFLHHPRFSKLCMKSSPASARMAAPNSRPKAAASAVPPSVMLSSRRQRRAPSGERISPKRKAARNRSGPARRWACGTTHPAPPGIRAPRQRQSRWRTRKFSPADPSPANHSPGR